jgi:hypothetical protein
MDVSGLFSPIVSRTSPKTKSYDPINGSPIQYDFSGGRYQRVLSPPPQTQPRYASNSNYKPFRNAVSPGSPFRDSGGLARVGSMALMPPVPAATIYAKTRPRNEVVNPITGSVTHYNIDRSQSRSLDNIFKTHLASSYEPVRVPYTYKPTCSSPAPEVNRIAGALKKSPDIMTYVNLYSL